MTPEQEKREKQQEAGIRWMEMLAENEKRKSRPVGAGCTFFGMVILAISIPLAEMGGNSIIAWPGIFYYIAIFVTGMALWYLLWKLTGGFSEIAQNLLFWGLGWVVGLASLWLTRSEELLRYLVFFLLLDLVFEGWGWLRKRQKKEAERQGKP
jgi:hypothetical protein